MSGSPGLGGTQPTSTNGLANQIAGHGITNNQPGVNAATAGNYHYETNNVYHHLCTLKWIETKGSKFEYGFSIRVDAILGIKHTVIGGFKTGLDIAWNRTYDIKSYRSLNALFKYEAIIGKKEEIVHGRKNDKVIGAKEIQRTDGAWTSTYDAQLAKRQKNFKAGVDDLIKEYGQAMDEITKSWEAEVKNLDLKATQLRQACSAKVDESCKTMEQTITTMKENIKKMETSCKEFELKTAQMDNAVDSALKIRTPSSKIKGSMIEIKASTQKFLADLVKLGE